GVGEKTKWGSDGIDVLPNRGEIWPGQFQWCGSDVATQHNDGDVSVLIHRRDAYDGEFAPVRKHDVRGVGFSDDVVIRRDETLSAHQEAGPGDRVLSFPVLNQYLHHSWRALSEDFVCRHCRRLLQAPTQR